MTMNRYHQDKYPLYVLALFLMVNLLNYIDRQILYAVFPLIKADFRLSDTELGFLGSAFMVCYMVTAPFFGWIGDRMSRVKLSSAGLFLWSGATALPGVVTGYGALFLSRMTVGIGEASFGTVAPGLISDYFLREYRGRALSLFYLAIPVGSALGYVLGGYFGQRFGWQVAFLLVGIPGILLAWPVWLLREPPRGARDRDVTDQHVTVKIDYVSLFRNRSYVSNTLAMTAMTFALGGLAQWVPSFLFRVHHLDVATGNLFFGGITVCAGITGTLIGGWVGDLMQKRDSRGYVILSGWGFLIGSPLASFALLTDSLSWCLMAIFFAEFFLFLNTGPLNTVIVNVTSPEIRAMAFAVNIFVIHALGDALSPTLLGYLSDIWGLRYSLLVTPLVLLLASLFCFLCGRTIEEDMRRYG